MAKMAIKPDQAQFMAISIVAIMARILADDEAELVSQIKDAFEDGDPLTDLDIHRLNDALVDLSKELGLRARQLLRRHDEYMAEQVRAN